MRWAEGVARMRKNKMCVGVLVKKPKGNRPVERKPWRDSKIKVLLKKYDTRTWTGLIWHNWRTPDRFP